MADTSIENMRIERRNENTYDYSNSILSGSGITEHLVREGYVNDPNFLHQPRRGGDSSAKPHIPSSMTEVSLPEDQYIQGFDKNKVIVWERKTSTGREIVSYDGKFYFEFLRGYSDIAHQWSQDRIKSGKADFKSFEKKGRWLYELSDTASLEEIRTRGIDLVSLRSKYDEAKDITPYFTDMVRRVDGEHSRYFLENTLKDLENSIRLEADVKAFSSDPDNYPKYYFGGRLTGSDIGFYIDNAGRIRASYDPHFLYRSEQLLKDLMELGQPEEYIVARLHTGMIHFVISLALTKRIVEKYKTLDAVAAAWNNEKIVYTNDFRFGNYPGFETTLDLQSKQYVESSYIFDYYIAENSPTDPKK